MLLGPDVDDVAPDGEVHPRDVGVVEAGAAALSVDPYGVREVVKEAEP
jgi:hypothetical protein